MHLSEKMRNGKDTVSLHFATICLMKHSSVFNHDPRVHCRFLSIPPSHLFLKHHCGERGGGKVQKIVKVSSPLMYFYWTASKFNILSLDACHSPCDFLIFPPLPSWFHTHRVWNVRRLAGNAVRNINIWMLYLTEGFEYWEVNVYFTAPLGNRKDGI